MPGAPPPRGSRGAEGPEWEIRLPFNTRLRAKVRLRGANFGSWKGQQETMVEGNARRGHHQGGGPYSVDRGRASSVLFLH